MEDYFKVYRDPWWDARTEISKEQKFWNGGFDEGYDKGVKDTEEYNETSEQYELRIDQLENLLAANVRVIKEELRREIEEKEDT